MKCQVSAEFLVVLSALVFVFFIVSVIYYGQNISLFQAQDSTATMRNAYAISFAINYVHLAGDGAQYNLSISGKRSEENITINNFSIDSRRSHSFASAPLLTSKINAQNIENVSILIKNSNGGIVIEQ